MRMTCAPMYLRIRTVFDEEILYMPNLSTYYGGMTFRSK